MIALMILSAFAAEPEFGGVADDRGVVEEPITDLDVELGGAYNGGNAVNFTMNGKVHFSYRWDANMFGTDIGTMLNLVKVDQDGDGTLSDAEREEGFSWSQQKVYGRVRYDRFFTAYDALYISANGERDPLAGLEFRFNQQVGYRRDFFNSDKVKLNLEVGFAYTEENFVTGRDDNGNIIDDAVVDAHYLAARLAIGFDYVFNENVTIGNSLMMTEPLYGSFADGSNTNWEDFRLLNNLSLTAKISKIFSFKTSYLVQFDNQPVPGFRKTDHNVLLTIVADIF